VKPAIFFDRDGVLNEPVVRDGKPHPPAGPEDVIVCDGAPAALRELKCLGFVLICVTNQPDVARGALSGATLDAINARLCEALPLDAIYDCRHDDVDGCACRKPKPGLIFAGAAAFDIDVATSYLVGDRWRDIEAGAAAHCRTVFIDRGYTERGSTIPPDITVSTISEAAAWIVQDAGARG
jgi:D-glycero-D-manno-heptose 1,7-bisphosphate phosphatase